MRGRTMMGAIAACALVVGSASAQTTPPPQAGPAIRVLDSASVSTSEPLMSASQVRALRGGRVLVNDGMARRLLLFDSTLALIRVIADSAPGAENPYGVRAGRLLPYRGDSTVLVDGGSYSMLVIDPDGNIANITATPRPSHLTYLSGTGYGNPGVDSHGRLIYRISDPSTTIRVATGGGVVVPIQPDSAPVLRLNLDTRVLDTAGKVKIQKRITEAYRTPSGLISPRTLTTPMPLVDDWAVMSDGSVAFVRHSDYHIDWLNADGSWTSSPPMPFDWQRMSDAHKQAFVDSTRRVLEDQRNRNLARYDSINLACFKIPRPERPGVVLSAPPAARGTGSAPAASKPVNNCPASAYVVDQMLPPMNVTRPELLPDVKPPFGPNSTQGDEDGNLWIRVNQMKPVPNTFLYDIVNRQGELFDRIQIPVTRTLVGFAEDGMVYVTARVGGKLRLERVRWR